ncbi:hypothetical protein ABIE09_000303 [Lysobacter enzymogenes]|uniref:Imm30 family immunity protein n=1 Tax=Lysobacter enzymogenes TaxID=69 RepID=UPI0033955924
MEQDYEAVLRSLEREIRCGDADAERIDEHIAALFGQIRSSMSLDLLRLLDDRAGSDGMFSLIHAAEAAPLDSYLDALLQALADLRESAPEWAQIVLVRAVNHSQAWESLARKLATAPATARAAVAWGCDEVDREGARFPERTAAIRLAAGCA